MSQPPERALTARMADLARAVAPPRPAIEVFGEVTAAAVELIPGVDTAGILLIGENDEFDSYAGTSELPSELDDLQHTLQEGPCMAAALEELMVRTDDFRAEPRWPAYAPAVVALGVLSGLSFRLYTHERSSGALNLFGFAPTVWGAEGQMTGTVLAAHAAAALTAQRHTEDLTTRLLARDRIAQAKGILMERFGIDDVQAFDLMQHLAHESGTPVFDVARRVIDTRGAASDDPPTMI